MRSMLYIFLTFFGFSLHGQITVSSDNFPAIGDTLFQTDDAMPVGIAVGGNGGPSTWDFSSLVPGAPEMLVFLDAADGVNSAAFPGADMVTIEPNTGAETYFRSTASEFSIIGFSGGDVTGLGLDVNAKYNPPLVLRRAPMDFFDVNQAESDLSLAFSVDALPDSIVPGIPGVDSIRFRLHSERLDVVDAFGELTIPAGNYNVLREKRTLYTTTAVDVYSFLGWQDLSGIFGDIAGIDTTVNYNYVSNTLIGDVANLVFNSDESELESVTFHHKGMTNSTLGPVFTPGPSSVQAYPNPAFEDVSFQCRNLPRGKYTLKVFDLLGITVWKETRELAGNTKVVLDLEDIKKGTYLYSLTAENGQKIGTKRLVVIKP